MLASGRPTEGPSDFVQSGELAASWLSASKAYTVLCIVAIYTTLCVFPSGMSMLLTTKGCA